jgi:GTPase SAR1 family protein
MPRRGRLIVFLGLVGVGKSTVIRGLANELRARGFRVSTTFIKAFHGPSYLLWMYVTRLLDLRNGRLSPLYVIPRSGRLGLARVLTILSAYLDAFISIPFKLIKVLMLRALGFYVLSEEYMHSTLIDYVHSYIALGLRGWVWVLPLSVINLLLSSYSPDNVIILDASDDVLRERWGLRGYGDPQLRYVRLQRVVLMSMINDGVVINTDGLGVIDEVRLIMARVISDHVDS